MRRDLRAVRIVLVEPAGPLNVGSVARVMKNFGLGPLVLVNPQCDPQCDEALMMAVHGRDVLERAQRVDRLPEALVGVQRAIATTGSVHDLPTPLEPPRQVLPWLLGSSGGSGGVNQGEPLSAALIFGREDSGLTNQELHYAQRLLQIPSDEVYPSLNLAQAVAVCCYELSQALTDSDPQSSQSPRGSALPLTEPPAAQEVLEGFYQQLETLLLQIGYLYDHTATRRMQRFRRLGHRAQLSHLEVQMLRGILSQMEWAIRQRALRDFSAND